jgi:hypothetical protein
MIPFHHIPAEYLMNVDVALVICLADQSSDVLIRG